MKCSNQSSIFDLSPSMRREWIEIATNILLISWQFVSLHAEGVD